jgi:hypothetical protein
LLRTLLGCALQRPNPFGTFSSSLQSWHHSRVVFFAIHLALVAAANQAVEVASSASQERRVNGRAGQRLEPEPRQPVDPKGLGKHTPSVTIGAPAKGSRQVEREGSPLASLGCSSCQRQRRT